MSQVSRPYYPDLRSPAELSHAGVAEMDHPLGAPAPPREMLFSPLLSPGTKSGQYLGR